MSCRKDCPVARSSNAERRSRSLLWAKRWSLDEHGGVGIVPPVQNCLLCDFSLLGIRAKEVEERLDIRPLSSKGRGYQK